MKRRLSSLKMYIVLISLLWSISAIYGILNSFEIKGIVFDFATVILTLLSFIYLYKKYNPVMIESIILKDCIQLSSRKIHQHEILKAIAVGPLEKIFFTIKSPKFDYSTSFLSKGIIIKTLYDSYLIDNIDNNFTYNKKTELQKNTNLNYILLCLLSLYPICAPIISYYLEIDSLLYVLLMAVFLFLIVFRILPPFYLGTKIDVKDLPLSDIEKMEFKSINIIEGFVLSDKLSVIPLRKQQYLDGLAVDLFLKKYIVLNPRLFSLGSADYQRFVLFHELCHIKHHDSSRNIILPIGLILIDLLISLFEIPLGVYITYYDYIFIGVAFLCFLIAVLKRKKIEQRADKYGIERIGKDALENIHSELGINLNRV